MKKLLLLLLVTSLAAWGQNTFTGTWRVDLNKAQFPQKPETWVLQDGMYRCTTCVPAIDVKADGADQPATGHPGWNTINVHPVNNSTVEFTFKKDGKVVSTVKETLSADGKRLTQAWTEHLPNSSQPSTGAAVMTRVSKGPAGSHPISGSWRTEKLQNLSENAMTVTLKTTDNEMSLSTPTGISYTAKFDGKDYPVKGDPGATSVSLKKINANTVEETDKRDGKVVAVIRMTLQPDGKTMDYSVEDKLHGTTSKFVAEKQ